MNTLSAERQNNIQEQLSNEQKLVSFDMRELTIEFYVTKYLTNIDKLARFRMDLGRIM